MALSISQFLLRTRKNSIFTTSSASILGRYFPSCPICAPIFLSLFFFFFFSLYNSFELGIDEFCEFRPSLSFNSAFSILSALFSDLKFSFSISNLFISAFSYSISILKLSQSLRRLASRSDIFTTHTTCDIMFLALLVYFLFYRSAERIPFFYCLSM